MGRTQKQSLRLWREANDGLSQEAAAAMVGISQAMWSLLERGAKAASPRVAKRIERLTGVSADTLMDWGDNENEGGSGAPSRLPRRFVNNTLKV